MIQDSMHTSYTFFRQDTNALGALPVSIEIVSRVQILRQGINLHENMSKPWSSKLSSPSSSSTRTKLTTDSSHVPKIHGSLSLLVIGLEGASGTSMLAGILTNRRKLQWFWTDLKVKVLLMQFTMDVLLS